MKVNKKNCVVKPIHDVDVKHSLLNANFEPICATCKKSLFDGVHDKCFLDFVKNVNSRAKSTKKHTKQNIWKPTGHVFTEVGFKWKPTGRTFTIVGNLCPLTRFTSANVVPPKKTTSHSIETQKPKLKVYSRKPKNVKVVGSGKKAKIVESKNPNHSEPNHTWGFNAIDIPSSSYLVRTGIVRFGNDHISRIMGYGDYQLGNVTISKVESSKTSDSNTHVLSSTGLKCSTNAKPLETNILGGSKRTDIPTSSSLVMTGIVRFGKDNMLEFMGYGTITWKCYYSSMCINEKSKKSSPATKAEDTNQEKLYFAYGLGGPMLLARNNRENGKS
ncbi:hypothetical protein Tco_1215472 [Tanacetum coccineum]